MLSNQILQKTVRDIADIVGVECSVWNIDGTCLAYSSLGEEPDKNEIQSYVKNIDEEIEIVSEKESYFSVYSEEGLIYILVIHSAAEEMKMVGRLGVKQLEALMHAYQERMNRNQFIQNLLDNMLLVDVYNRAKKMNIEIEARRAVVLIEPKNSGDSLVLEMLKGIYATSTKDFVTAVDESHIILVKSLEESEGYKELNEIAKSVVDVLNTEAMVNVRVAYGTIVKELKDVSKSYKEAGMALDVGRIFYEEKNILAYSELGIGRLIHQLPVSLCDMFLKEVFAGKAVDQFEEETLATVYKFFENNLNISETARQLFLHRNTRVSSRKIQKKTGLDVRVFDDALTFKIALMVASHLKSFADTGLE